jgi:hypothetical protein
MRGKRPFNGFIMGAPLSSEPLASNPYNYSYRYRRALENFYMFMINRSVLTVKPKKPYIDWANGLEEEGPKLSLDDPREELTVYLVDEVEFDSDTDKVIDEHYSKIFKHELYSWHLVEEDWPEHRDRKTFHDWFEVEAHSLILDLCDYAIEIEDFAG